MKRFSVIALMLLLVVAFSLPASASVATNPGIKPGSFFYFFDTTFEKIGLFFTFSPEKKAEKALEYADERLAEAEAVTGNAEAVKTAITNYESNIAFAAEKSKDVGEKEKAEALLISIADNTSKHQEVLIGVLARVPDDAKEAITKAIEASRRGQEEALKKIAELKGEVEQLKQEMAELKAKDEERERMIEELNKQKPESTSTPTKPATTQSPETGTTPKPAATTPQTPKTSIVTLPNGAVVEMDTSGNIIRYLKESPQQTYSEPITNTSVSSSVSISLGKVQVTSGSVHIEWTTNVPADSKIFLIQPDGSAKIISSASGNSTIHFVDITTLISGTSYKYTIEAIAGTQSKKIDGSFTTDQQTFAAESIKSPTNPNDTVPFLKLSSDRSFTIKKLVFLDDGTYCREGAYPFVQLTLQYSSQGKDAPKDITDSIGRFIFEFPDGLTSSNITFRLTSGTSGAGTSCLYDGMKFILRDSESIIFGENGKQIDVPHVVLIGK